MMLMIRCLVAQREEWRDAWLAGEAGEAQAVAEGALEAPGAWDPAPATWLMDSDDDALFGNSGQDGARATRPAWQVGLLPPFLLPNTCCVVPLSLSS